MSDVIIERGLPTRVPQSSGYPKHAVGDSTPPLLSEVSFASNLTTPSPLAECKLLGKLAGENLSVRK